MAIAISIQAETLEENGKTEVESLIFESVLKADHIEPGVVPRETFLETISYVSKAFATIGMFYNIPKDLLETALGGFAEDAAKHWQHTATEHDMDFVTEVSNGKGSPAWAISVYLIANCDEELETTQIQASKATGLIH